MKQKANNAKKKERGDSCGNRRDAQITVTFSTDGAECLVKLERFHYPLFIYPLHLSSFSPPPAALTISHSDSLS